jgi:hypothetical protein
MTKVIRIYNFTLESENEFTKIFKDGDIGIYLSKAFDEDANKHYVVASIPNIEEIDASDIKYPFPFDTTYERDDFFDSFDVKNASEFIRDLVNYIKEQQELQKEQKNDN